MNPTLLTSGGTGTDATSHTTASITPTANRLVLVCVVSRCGAGAAVIPTVTGCGMTWVVEESLSRSLEGLSVTRGMSASPSAGSLTLDFGAQTATGCDWIVIEFDDVDTSGSNGSGAVAQSESAGSATTATSGLVTLGAFASANNGTFGLFTHRAAEPTDPGTGFTEIADISSTLPPIALMAMWRADNATTVDASWASTQHWVGIGLELVKAAGGGATATPAVIAASVASPLTALSAGSTVAASPLSTVAASPAATVATGETVQPAVVAASSALPASALSAGSTVTPAAVPAVAALPAVVVSAGGNATVNPTAAALWTALPAAVITAGSTVTPGAVPVVVMEGG